MTKQSARKFKRVESLLARGKTLRGALKAAKLSASAYYKFKNSASAPETAEGGDQMVELRIEDPAPPKVAVFVIPVTQIKSFMEALWR